MGLPHPPAENLDNGPCGTSHNNPGSPDTSKIDAAIESAKSAVEGAKGIANQATYDLLAGCSEADCVNMAEALSNDVVSYIDSAITEIGNLKPKAVEAIDGLKASVDGAVASLNSEDVAARLHLLMKENNK